MVPRAQGRRQKHDRPLRGFAWALRSETLRGEKGGLSQRLYRLETGGLASGAYWIRVSDGTHSTSKKLLIH